MIEQGSLPKNCEFNLGVAINYANMAKTQLEAGNIQKAIEFNGVVIEQLKEIKEKVERAGK